MISLLLSLWCSPIDGSSSTYKTPVSLEPIWVASLIRCASPPDRVPALRASVRYDKPTFIKKLNLELISLIIKLDISCCSLLSFKLLKNVYKSSILRSVNSYIFFLPIRTDNTESSSLEPWHVGQGNSVINCSIQSLIQPLFVSI